MVAFTCKTNQKFGIYLVRIHVHSYYHFQSVVLDVRCRCSKNPYGNSFLFFCENSNQVAWVVTMLPCMQSHGMILPSKTPVHWYQLFYVTTTCFSQSNWCKSLMDFGFEFSDQIDVLQINAYKKHAWVICPLIHLSHCCSERTTWCF